MASADLYAVVNTDLYTVAQLKQELQKVLAELEKIDPTKPVNLAFNDEEGNQSQHGFLTQFSIGVALSDDDEQNDLNLDLNFEEA